MVVTRRCSYSAPVTKYGRISLEIAATSLHLPLAALGNQYACSMLSLTTSTQILIAGCEIGLVISEAYAELNDSKHIIYWSIVQDKYHDHYYQLVLSRESLRHRISRESSGYGNHGEDRLYALE